MRQISLFFILIFLVVGCDADNKGARKKGGKVKPVEVVIVERAPLTTTRDVTGTLEATRTVHIYNEEQVRNEMFLHLDYYVTESSGHNSEYNWWFRKRPDLIEKYCTDGTGWNPGHYAYILNQYRERGATWKDAITEWLDNPEPLNLARGHEYAASIMNALIGGDAFEFNGNVPNTKIITNLPDDV